MYQAHAEIYLRRWDRRSYRVPRLLREVSGQWQSGATLLDLGSGAGQDTRYLRRARYHVIGLDLTWSLLVHTRGHSRRVPLVQADLRDLPFRPGVFDGIWAAASLIHLPKPATRALLRALRHLVPQGAVMGATFVHGQRSGILQSGWIPGRFFSRWQKVELERAVRTAGWEVISLKTVQNRERKGRWLNLIARAPIRDGPPSVRPWP